MFSTDDYYRPRTDADYPRDEKGELDHEDIRALGMCRVLFWIIFKCGFVINGLFYLNRYEFNESAFIGTVTRRGCRVTSI